MFHQIIHEVGVVSAVDVASDSFISNWRMKRDRRISQLLPFESSMQCSNVPNGYNPERIRRVVESHLADMVGYIDNARYSIDMCFFILADPLLVQAIVRASTRGVVIRMIIDTAVERETHRYLFEGNFGISFKSLKDVVPHNQHKFIIIDSTPRLTEMNCQTTVFERLDRQLEIEPNGIVMSGSLEWVRNRTLKSGENILISTNFSIINQFQYEYDNMWNTFNPLFRI